LSLCIYILRTALQKILPALLIVRLKSVHFWIQAYKIYQRWHCSKRKTKWQLTVMQITSKALKLNFWQHKTRQYEIHTNTKSWKYGECKHCWPLVKKSRLFVRCKSGFWIQDRAFVGNKSCCCCCFNFQMVQSY
jgi:hypothetical protein